MRISAYIHPPGMQDPTGVGKHQIYMPHSLAGLSGVLVSLLAHRGETAQGRLPADNPLANLPLTTIPFSRRLAKLFWMFMPGPAIDRWCPDADWVYCPFEALFPVRRALRAATIHAVFWFEKDLPWYPEWQGFRTRLKPVFQRIVAEYDLVFTVSEFLKGRLCELFSAAPGRIRVVGNGVEDAFYQEYNMPVDASSGYDFPYILIVNPLTARKGAEELLAVVRMMQTLNPDLKFIHAGGQFGEARFLRAAAGLPNLILKGYVGLPELPRLMRRALGLMNLSLTETFGIPVAEAMAAGTPVIAARRMALPEIVGDAGLLVDESRPGEVAEQIQSLYHDSALRQSLVDKGRARALNFTWAACAERLARALEIGERGHVAEN